MPEKRNQDQAISLNDEGGASGEPFRAQIAIGSRFVLNLRASGRFTIAGWSATMAVIAVTLTGQADLQLTESGGHHHVHEPQVRCPGTRTSSTYDGWGTGSRRAAGSQSAPK
jgi:hypothetical protein